MSALEEAEINPPPSNAARLQLHLRPQSLATALLNVWNPAEPHEKRRARLFQTLNTHHPGNTPIDAAASTDQD